MALRLRSPLTIAFVAAILAALVVGTASCGGGASLRPSSTGSTTGASSDTGKASTASPDFTLQVFGASGSGVPCATEKNLRVTATRAADGTTTVLVSVVDADNISAALMHLKFDPTAYVPIDVVQGPFFGRHTIFFTLTDRRGIVPIGVIIPNPDKNPGVSGTGLVATVRFAPAGKTSSRSIGFFNDAAPTAPVDQVLLGAIALDSSNYPVIDFFERNRGDGNNNGEVEISDLVPVALYYAQQVATSPFLDIVDFNIDGEVGIADLGPMAEYYATTLLGYDVEWTNDQVAGPWTRLVNPNNATALATIRRVPDARPTAPLTTDGWVHYVFKDTANPALLVGKRYYRVTPIATNTPPDKGIISTVGTATGLGGYTSLHFTAVDTHLILTEKTQNPLFTPATWEPFAKKTVQLQCMGTPIGGGPDEDVTASAQWIVVNNDWAAGVGNTTGTKGLVTGIDRGLATVRAYAPHRLDLFAETPIQVCTIDSILVKANGNTSPVTVPLGGNQQFTAQGVFADGQGGPSDSVNEDLTTFVNWLEWPPVDPITHLPTNHGIFIFDSLGKLYLTDPNLLSGDSELVFAEFPTVEPITLNFGYKATSNTILATAG